jgi:hypothetical protein
MATKDVLDRGGDGSTSSIEGQRGSNPRDCARETPPTRVPTHGEHEMKHVQLPLDGEVLPRDPADDDPLLPRRSAATIWLALAVACTAAWTVAAVALAIWQS